MERKSGWRTMVSAERLLVFNRSHPHFVVVDNKVTPIWNTVAVIPGHITDEVVAIGNHRDGT